MKLAALITEVMLFQDFYEFKIDPDRADTADLIDRLLPLIVKMAYTNLYHDREKHEKKYGPKSSDEDAYNFDFNEEKLVELVEELTDDLSGKLRTLKTADVKETIKAVEKEFKVPLEKD